MLVEPSVLPSMSSVVEVALSEQRAAFELPQIMIADDPASTGFGSALNETAGAGGMRTGTAHVAV